MKDNPSTLDHLSAPRLRSTLTCAEKKIQQLEKDNDQLRRALVKQNDQLVELRRLVLKLTSEVSALKEQNEALCAQNEQIRGQYARVLLLKDENAKLKQELSLLRAVTVVPPRVDPVQRTAPVWAKANRAKVSRKKERKKRKKSYGRHRARLSEVTEIVEHVPSCCPDCGTVLSDGWLHRSFQVIGLPKLEPVLTEHHIMARQCPNCHKRVIAPLPELPERIGRHRFSVSVIARVVRLGVEARLPLELIQGELKQGLGLSLSEGCIVGLLQAAAKKGKGAYERLREEIRGSPVVHADETGWREDGQNGYIWSFSTERARYFYWDRSRSGDIPLGVLGEDYLGVVVTDFYAAYNRLEGLHQRCWAHLLRDVHELKGKNSEDMELARWAAGVKSIYAAACAESNEPREKRAQKYEEQLLGLCPEGMAKERPEAVLSERIRRYMPELFMFVRDPLVPSTNNAAERSVRPLVIGRKISGGSRSEVGTETRMILASLVGTAKLRGQDLETAIQGFLTT